VVGRRGGPSSECLVSPAGPRVARACGTAVCCAGVPIHAPACPVALAGVTAPRRPRGRLQHGGHGGSSHPHAAGARCPIGRRGGRAGGGAHRLEPPPTPWVWARSAGWRPWGGHRRAPPPRALPPELPGRHCRRQQGGGHRRRRNSVVTPAARRVGRPSRRSRSRRQAGDPGVVWWRRRRERWRRWQWRQWRWQWRRWWRRHRKPWAAWRVGGGAMTYCDEGGRASGDQEPDNVVATIRKKVEANHAADDCATRPSACIATRES